MMVYLLLATAAGLLISLILAIYQAVEARRIEKTIESLAEFDWRYDAILQAWQEKHPIMPYGGSSVAWFIGFFGFFIPVGVVVLITMIFMLFR